MDTQRLRSMPPAQNMCGRASCRWSAPIRMHPCLANFKLHKVLQKLLQQSSTWRGMLNTGRSLGKSRKFIRLSNTQQPDLLSISCSNSTWKRIVCCPLATDLHGWVSGPLNLGCQIHTLKEDGSEVCKETG